MPTTSNPPVPFPVHAGGGMHSIPRINGVKRNGSYELYMRVREEQGGDRRQARAREGSGGVGGREKEN